ncbi:NEK kinase [Apiospora saccharicola]|uniref:NEK kinase n=1 Tax=Apiospora saccharicola TaxID=335842 RepID=A0ABR1UQE9_9PEZI
MSRSTARCSTDRESSVSDKYDLGNRPGPDYRRIVVFPVDQKQLVWNWARFQNQNSGLPELALSEYRRLVNPSSDEFINAHIPLNIGRPNPCLRFGRGLQAFAVGKKLQGWLQAEFQILSSLRHPNIVGYYHREHLKISQDLHLYMEYCGNSDLGRVIRELTQAGAMLWLPRTSLFATCGHFHGNSMVINVCPAPIIDKTQFKFQLSLLYLPYINLYFIKAAHVGTLSCISRLDSAIQAQDHVPFSDGQYR